MYVLRKSPLASMFCPISQTEKEGSADIQKLGAESRVSGQNGYFARVFYPISKLGQGILCSLEDFVLCPEYKCWAIFQHQKGLSV